MARKAWPHDGWWHADKALSDRATELLGRQCYVCPGYDPDTLDNGFMIADGIHTPVCISLIEELAAGVAELRARRKRGD